MFVENYKNTPLDHPENGLKIDVVQIFCRGKAEAGSSSSIFA